MILGKVKRLLRRKTRSVAAGVLTKQRLGPERVRLSWVWTTKRHPDANLGDALSAVVVSAMSGLAVQRASFGEDCERMAAVGTIGHAQRNGKVHLWGTGFDLKRNWTGSIIDYQLPTDTTLIVHGVRGKRTAAGLRKLGLPVPEVYGDPVWFLPRIFPFDPVKKDCDLGVIVHISELDSAVAGASVRANLARYGIPVSLAGSIRIINTYAPATLEGLREKVSEIVTCRRILSTSLHGLVIAEAYGIPCAWFATYEGASGFLSVDGSCPIDHRMIDFYTGGGVDSVLSYLQPLHLRTDWDAAMRFLDANWHPLEYSGHTLFQAFPLEPAVRFEDSLWQVPPGLLESNPY